MPIYNYRCTCGWSGDLIVRMKDRDQAHCPNCTRSPERQVAAPMFRFAGRSTPGGGADGFTAAMLGIPVKELPPSLRTPQDQCDG